VDDRVVEIPKLPANCKGFLWDTASNSDVFVAYDAENLYTYIYQPGHVMGGGRCICGGAAVPPSLFSKRWRPVLMLLRQQL
jgi:hypothetical protein